jgi:hypothetical protein
MFECKACGHPGVHAQVLAPQAGFRARFDDCSRCRATADAEEPSRPPDDDERTPHEMA